MRRYYALVHYEDGYAFGVQFPDLPGAFSAADAEKDIITNAMESLQLYFEGRIERESATSLKELVKREEIAKELAAGAFFVSVPFIENANKAVRANITIDNSLLQAIDAEARRRKMNRSAFLAQAARQAIGA
ncbi:MAG: ribbon-helix-helix protein, CopG family [Candidatus Tokpelaia sp.]|nr:MAG: ribbon-helix-helix protein, CopG family [Candidatus Tokpelaia sp.]KAA6205057.1 MAG: ribbon-helix-helix protein, CopG family [Candidatus Tokpelaia sp.]